MTMLPVPAVLEGEIIAPGEGVTVVVRASPLRDERHVITVPAGLSIAEIIAGFVVPLGYRADWLRISLGGDVIARELWPRIRLKPGASLAVQALPQGKWVRQALLAVVAVVALVVAPYVAAPLLAGLGIAAGTVAASLITASIGLAITAAGTLAVNALFPVAKTSAAGLTPITSASIDPASASSLISTDSSRSPTYAIGGGRNEARPYGAIPVLLGTHRISPPLGAKTYTESVGDEQYLRMLFVWGYGPMVVSDLKIGETPVSNFEGVEVETWEQHNAETLRLFPDQVFEEPLAVEMTGQTSWVMRTTADDVDEISVDIVFPGGLYRFEQATGARRTYSVGITVQYSPAGVNSWAAFGQFIVTSDSLSALRRSLRLTVPRGQYDVRMVTNPVYSGPDTVQEQVVWSALRGIRKDLPIKSGAPLTISVMRIKASSQLSGTIDTFNGVARMRVKSWNDAAWADGVLSNNPADLFRHVLQCPANASPVADAEIDLESLQGWHAHCAANGFAFNQVRDFTASVFETLRDIAVAGRAAVSLRDGRWGVIWDQGDSQPIVQHFTPRNCSGFEGVRGFVDMPHGFRVRFINGSNGWLQDERVVYDDGYSASNATRFEGLDFPGVTDPDLIWRHGRYHLAQLRLRRETYSINTDFEGLVCTRGDRVRVQHDVPQWGLGSARVRSVDAGVQSITLDEPMAMQAGQRYTLRARLADGASLTREVQASPGATRVLTLVGTGALPAVGDLVLFGVLTRESVILRVLSIEPQRDMTARIHLVDDAPGIQSADQGVIPPFDTGAPPPVDYYDLPPRDLAAVEALDASGQTVRSRLNVTWAAPSSGAASLYIVERRLNGGDWGGLVSRQGTQTDATLFDLAPGFYDLRLRAFFAGGQSSRAAVLSGVRVGLLSDPPGDVQGFAIATMGDVSTLAWLRDPSPIVASYRIKFTPATSGASWATSAVLAEGITGGSLQTAAQLGTYLIKAVSAGGAESVDPAIIISTVAGVTALNSVESIDEAPGFTGTKTGVILDDEGRLRLINQDDLFTLADWFGPADYFYAASGLPPQGVYGFAGSVDLGDIYTVRITSQIDAFGERITGDFFTLADVFAQADWFGVAPSQWDVTIQTRATNDNPAGSPVWSAWTPLVIGDVTGRAFQFRAVFNSYQSDVTPIVSSLSVTVDMPDRVIAGDDIAVAAAGAAILFTPPFRRLQGLGIAAQDMATGDRYEITGKTEGGFTIRFFNSSGAGVARTFDYVAKGYGAVQ